QRSFRSRGWCERDRKGNLPRPASPVVVLRPADSIDGVAVTTRRIGQQVETGAATEHPVANGDGRRERSPWGKERLVNRGLQAALGGRGPGEVFHARTHTGLRGEKHDSTKLRPDVPPMGCCRTPSPLSAAEAFDLDWGPILWRGSKSSKFLRTTPCGRFS